MPNGPCDCGYMADGPDAEVETFTAAEIVRAHDLRNDPDSEDNERFASWYGDTLLAVHEDYVARVPGMERDLRGALAARDHLRLTVKFQREEEARLRASKADLLAALEPFANLGVTTGPDDEPCPIPYRITRGSIRNARAAITRATGDTPA